MIIYFKDSGIAPKKVKFDSETSGKDIRRETIVSEVIFMMWSAQVRRRTPRGPATSLIHKLLVYIGATNRFDHSKE